MQISNFRKYVCLDATCNGTRADWRISIYMRWNDVRSFAHWCVRASHVCCMWYALPMWRMLLNARTLLMGYDVKETMHQTKEKRTNEMKCVSSGFFLCGNQCMPVCEAVPQCNIWYMYTHTHSPHAFCHSLRRKSISNPMGDLLRLTQTNREKTENYYAQTQSHIKRLCYTLEHIHILNNGAFRAPHLFLVECGRPLIQHASVTIANFNSSFHINSN